MCGKALGQRLVSCPADSSLFRCSILLSTSSVQQDESAWILDYCAHAGKDTQQTAENGNHHSVKLPTVHWLKKYIHWECMCPVFCLQMEGLSCTTYTITAGTKSTLLLSECLEQFFHLHYATDVLPFKPILYTLTRVVPKCKCDYVILGLKTLQVFLLCSSISFQRSGRIFMGVKKTPFYFNSNIILSLLLWGFSTRFFKWKDYSDKRSLKISILYCANSLCQLILTVNVTWAIKRWGLLGGTGLWRYLELSNFPLLHLSKMMFQPWSQVALDWTLWNCEIK